MRKKPLHSYKVTVIRKGRELDFAQFWERGAKISSDGEPLHPDLVGFTVVIDATDLGDALSKARALHPGLQIAPNYSGKVS